VQDAESCDEGPLNGAPGSGCSASCSCGVAFKVIGKLHPSLPLLPTPVVVYGSAASDGSGCLNLDTKKVGGIAPRGLDVSSLRLSATDPTQSCPTTGGSTFFDLNVDWFYKLHLFDFNGDGIKDLLVYMKTKPIGASLSTTKLYLTGRFRDPGGPLGTGCFESSAPVNVCRGGRDHRDGD
jgi:hypothetical protein